MKIPNPRVNANQRLVAVKLAFRLLRIAASPFRVSGRPIVRIAGLQPEHPLPLPSWWPFDQPTGLSFDGNQIRLMRQAALEVGARRDRSQTTPQLETQPSDLSA